MKKILLSIFILGVFIVGCQKGLDIKKGDGIGIKEVETPEVETTGEASVDAVGNDLNNINSVEKDLSADELSDLDSGLEDIENI